MASLRKPLLEPFIFECWVHSNIVVLMHHYSIHHYFVYLQVQSWLWSTWVRTRQSCVVFCVITAWRQRWAAARYHQSSERAVWDGGQLCVRTGVRTCGRSVRHHPTTGTTALVINTPSFTSQITIQIMHL